jgi:hypothetical protein
LRILAEAVIFCKLLIMQILIRFPDKEVERQALGKLIPRFSGKSWSSGDLAVPSAALAYLANEGISFTVIGPATYERLAPLRDSRAAVL